jgi:16S rRNA (cytosine1402-N4)-methyltransferase
MEFSHTTVLLQEAVECLNINPGGIYIDATAGGGGHSREIARQLDTGRLIAIDKDPDAVDVLRQRLEVFPSATVVMEDFRNITAVAQQQNISSVLGVLLDLGVSSHQLDRAERGFSYHTEAPLDMRMAQQGMSAYDVVNGYSEAMLAKILREYGEERFAGRIARAIVAKREKQPILTTTELAEIVKIAIPAATRREGGHPAKRSFQAIRIEVNKELDSLSQTLDDAFSLLAPNGRIAVITFHSLEDRLVKRRFTQLCTGCTCPPDFPVCTCGKQPKARLVLRKPVVPSIEEQRCNLRSRSAKLRCIEKIEY